MTDFFMGFDQATGRGGLAQSMNLRFLAGELDRQYWIDNPDGVPELPLFKHGATTAISDMAYGSFAGLTVQVFTFDAVAYTDDAGHDRRTCILFKVPGNFAPLSISPHTKLSRLQEKTKTPFSSRFRVGGRQEVTSLVLDEGMQRFLLGVDEHLRLELGGSALLGHTRDADADLVAVLLQQVYGVYLRIPDPAWDRYGNLPLA